jgi:hypothetical protein
MATTCKQAIANFEGNRIRNKKSEKADGENASLSAP